MESLDKENSKVIGRENFRYALFDMDGVLYNSMPNHVISYHKALLAHGIDMSEESVYMYEGKKGVDTIQLVGEQQLNRMISKSEAEAIYEEKCSVFRSLPPAEIIPGVVQLMRRMYDNGWQVCVVTGSGQLSQLAKLTTDFAPMITLDRIVSSKDYTKGKPAPDPYLMGLQRLGAKKEQTVVVENAPLGVKAGKAAGIFTCAVNTGPLAESVFEEAGADKVFPDMHSLESWLFDGETME